jgi:sugar/nucleoside kinase (ribokinase family)
MAEIWTMGEMLVEIMRPRTDLPLSAPAEFLGPYPSGAPAIFIDTVARLGHLAGIIGGVAKDDFGDCILERLHADGVDLRFVDRIPERATAVAFVTYFQDGSRKFIFHIDGTPAAMRRFPAEAATGKPAFFHVMGCSLMINEPFREEIFKAVESFHQCGAKICFDPNIRPELLGGRDLMEVVLPVMKRAAVVLPGEAELELLSAEQNYEKAVERLFESPMLELVVLKRGKQGATVFSREKTIDVPALHIQEVDPTGAGDCFDAGFLCSLLEGKPLEACGRIAAAAGALNAAAFGPMEGRISPDAIQELLQAHA